MSIGMYNNNERVESKPITVRKDEEEKESEQVQLEEMIIKISSRQTVTHVVQTRNQENYEKV